MALAFVAVLTCLPSAGLDAQGLRAGRNVNVSGRPPFQRENEPSIACSSRNPRFCVAGANDYTTIEVPGTLEDGHTADAWLGLYWTRDGGSRWNQGLLPGYPQDTTPQGLASPLKGYSAGADANVRAGANGYFYYSGIAFEREVVQGSSRIAGADGRSGVVFLSTFVDKNNTEDLNVGPEYVRTVVVDRAALGEVFLDKIWMQVDIPRAQGVPGKIYIAYVKIVGSGQFKLLFGVSTDNGLSFRFTKLSEGVSKLQSPTIAIDPDTGKVFVYVRRFPSGNGNVPSGIIGYVSSDFGTTFSKDVELRTLLVDGHSTAFDQPGLPNLETNPDAPTTRGIPHQLLPRGVRLQRGRVCGVGGARMGPECGGGKGDTDSVLHRADVRGDECQPVLNTQGYRQSLGRWSPVHAVAHVRGRDSHGVVVRPAQRPDAERLRPQRVHF